MLRWVQETLEGFHDGRPRSKSARLPKRSVALKAAARAMHHLGVDAPFAQVDSQAQLELSSSSNDPCADTSGWTLLDWFDCKSTLLVHWAEVELAEAVAKTLDELLATCVVVDDNGDPVWTPDANSVGRLTWKDPNTCRVEKALTEFVCALHDELRIFRIMLRSVVFTGTGAQMAASVAYDPGRLTMLREAWRLHVGGLLGMTGEFGRFAAPEVYDYDSGDGYPATSNPSADTESDTAKRRAGVAWLIREALHVPGSLKEHGDPPVTGDVSDPTGTPELFLDGLFLVGILSALYTLQDCSVKGRHAKDLNLHLWKAVAMLVRKERQFCITARMAAAPPAAPPEAEGNSGVPDDAPAPSNTKQAGVEATGDNDPLANGECDTEGLGVRYEPSSQLSSLLAVERRFRDVRVVNVFASVIDKTLLSKALKDFPLDVMYGHIPLLSELSERVVTPTRSP